MADTFMPRIPTTVMVNFLPDGLKVSLFNFYLYAVSLNNLVHSVKREGCSIYLGRFSTKSLNWK